MTAIFFISKFQNLTVGKPEFLKIEKTCLPSTLNFGCFVPSRFELIHCNSTRTLIKVHKNWRKFRKSSTPQTNLWILHHFWWTMSCHVGSEDVWICECFMTKIAQMTVLVDFCYLVTSTIITLGNAWLFTREITGKRWRRSRYTKIIYPLFEIL